MVHAQLNRQCQLFLRALLRTHDARFQRNLCFDVVFLTKSCEMQLSFRGQIFSHTAGSCLHEHKNQNVPLKNVNVIDKLLMNWSLIFLCAYFSVYRFMSSGTRIVSFLLNTFKHTLNSLCGSQYYLLDNCNNTKSSIDLRRPQ